MSAEDRTSYIGGPAAATILGVNPYQTELALWQRLTRRAPPIEVNAQMRSGQRLERAVLDYAGEELGQRVLPVPFIMDHDLPLGGHLDGMTEVSDEVVEAKTSRTRNGWGESGTADVPPGYAAQCLHYMGLTGAKRAHVAVLFSGLDFGLYTIERDDKLIDQMREICARWWRDYVVADMPPPPRNGADAALLWPKDSGKVVIADDAVADAVALLRGTRAQIASLEEQQKQLESRIKLCMGDAATLMVAGEAACTWKTTKPALRFDSAAFKLAQPETFKQFCRPSESRRFLLRQP